MGIIASKYSSLNLCFRLNYITFQWKPNITELSRVTGSAALKLECHVQPIGTHSHLALHTPAKQLCQPVWPGAAVHTPLQCETTRTWNSYYTCSHKVHKALHSDLFACCTCNIWGVRCTSLHSLTYVAYILFYLLIALRLETLTYWKMQIWKITL